MYSLGKKKKEMRKTEKIEETQESRHRTASLVTPRTRGRTKGGEAAL